MNRFLKKIPGSYLKNDTGAAAFMGSIIVIVLISTIAFGFWADTQQKQAGGAVTYTSANAFFLAESGFRYAEKCILASSPDPDCPCSTQNGSNGCKIDNALSSVVINKTFGSGRGSFNVKFSFDSVNNVATATSIGTFAGAQREFKKILCQTGSCPLSQSPITACTKLEISTNASTSVPIPSPPPTCPTSPLLDPLVFPDDPAGCPNAKFPNFVQATTPGGDLGAPDANGFQALLPLNGKFQYCNMTINGATKVKTSSSVTIWIGGDFKIKNNATLLINGTGVMNISKKAELTDASDIRIADGGSLTIQMDGDFSMKNSAGANVVADGGTGTPDPDPASLIILAGGKAKMKNSSTLFGAIIANSKIEMKNDSALNGAIMGDKVELENNSTITFASTAGSNASGFTQCKGGGGGAVCPTVLFVP